MKIITIYLVLCIMIVTSCAPSQYKCIPVEIKYRDYDIIMAELTYAFLKGTQLLANRNIFLGYYFEKPHQTYVDHLYNMLGKKHEVRIFNLNEFAKIDNVKEGDGFLILYFPKMKDQDRDGRYHTYSIHYKKFNFYEKYGKNYFRSEINPTPYYKIRYKHGSITSICLDHESIMTSEQAKMIEIK